MIINRVLFDIIGLYDTPNLLVGTTIESDETRASSFIAFIQTVSANKNVKELYQNISFYQYASINGIYQELAFIETVSVYRGGLVAEGIVFVEQGNVILNKRIIQHDTIIFREQAHLFKESSFYIQPTIPTISKSKSITLSYNTLSITVRAPELGDTDGIDEVRINRLSRGGDLIVYSDPNWPRTESLSYRFSFLTTHEITQLKDFVHATIGQSILLVDYDGLSWSVIITNPDFEFDQTSKNNYTATLEFEGIKL